MWSGKYVAPHAGAPGRIYINDAHSTGISDWTRGVVIHELGHALGLGDRYDDRRSVMYGDARDLNQILLPSDVAEHARLDKNGALCGQALGATQYAGPAAAVALPLIAGAVAILASTYGIYYLTQNPEFTGRRVGEMIPGGSKLGLDWLTEKSMIALAAISDGEGPPRPEWEGEGRNAENLPTEGESPYVPPKKNRGKPKWTRDDKRGEGWEDDKDRIWQWDKGAHGGPNWNVYPRGGGYWNVYPNGHVRG